MNHLPRIFSISAAALTFASLSFASSPATPTPRNVEYDWMSISAWYKAHAEDVEVAAKGEAQLLFVGDSITQGYQWAPSWEREFSKYKPANFGIGGDKTENLLWRIQNGSTGALDPKMVVMLIGVNNFGHNNDSPQAVFSGVKANLEQLQTSFPKAKILVLGVFPYDEKPDSPNRKRVKTVNSMVATLATDTVSVMDIDHVFLQEDGSISKEIMADFLHPTADGYELLTKAILPVVEKTMGE